MPKRSLARTACGRRFGARSILKLRRATRAGLPGAAIAGVHERVTDVQLWMGANAHLVAYPVSPQGSINLVVTLPGIADATDRSGADIAAALEKAGWPDQPCRLIAAAERLTPYPLLTSPLTMSRGRAALIGDAAHAMLPFAAQGAAMAIEDAFVLADCIAGDRANIASALARYSSLRRARVARVIRAAEQSGRIYHLSGAMALARDMTIRVAGGPRLLARQSWIYDWTPQ